MARQTPLNEAHRRLGARMVDFAGWDMPVQYTSLLAEHEAVRTAAGLFVRMGFLGAGGWPPSVAGRSGLAADPP